MQFVPAANDAVQVLVEAKSPVFAPDSEMLLIVNAALPVLLRVTDCGALVDPRFCPLKEMVEALKLATGLVPVPVSVTVCGLPEALSLIVTEAVRLPGAMGANATLMVQLPPAATEAPQVFVAGKSPGFAPVTPKLDMVSVALPLLVRVIVCAAADVLTNWLPNVRVVAESPTSLDVPVPVKFTVWGLPEALSVKTTEAVLVPAAVGANVTLTLHWAWGARELPQVLLKL